MLCTITHGHWCFSFPEHKWVKYDIRALCFLIGYEGILVSGICCSIFLQASAQGYANTGAVIRISHTGRFWSIDYQCCCSQLWTQREVEE